MGYSPGWSVDRRLVSVQMVQMLDIGALVASCGFARGLLIALFMPPPAEGVGWVIDGSSRLEINGGCYFSAR